MKLLIWFLIFANVHELIHGTATKFGPYCIANKGFDPGTVTEKDLIGKGLTPNITYKIELTPAKQECEKLINGTYKVHRRIKTLGMLVSVARYSDGVLLTGGKANDFRVENICRSKFNMKPFFDRFTGTFDESCSLDPGVYSLYHWTLYDHMKDLFPYMQIALYVVHVCWLENNEHCVMENIVTMDFKDASSREAEAKLAENGGVKGAKQRRIKKKDKEAKEEGVLPNFG